MKYWIIGILVICLIVGGIFVPSGFAGDNRMDENVSVAALTCTIMNAGDYVVDLEYKNPGIENRTIMIDPSGVKLDLLPEKTYRYYLHLMNEVSILNISVDDGTELQVQLPTCNAKGGSGSGVSGFSMDDQKTSVTTATPPVPELSPLVLTLAGISGLLLLYRTRKN